MNQSEYFKFHPDVLMAKSLKRPIVALESAVITHGLPFPENLDLARDMEKIIRSQEVVPATIALLDGKIQVGLSDSQLLELARVENSRKISRRDFGIALSALQAGGTTVAGTLFASHLAGIQVFATGGIGGVHRNSNFDISADLHELAVTPVVVVCAGAKSILDLPATLEVLETLGVPVIGYQTDEFPAFFSRRSGLSVNASCQKPEHIAEIAISQWKLGITSAVLVVNPIPEEFEIPYREMDAFIQKAIVEAEIKGIHGAAVTPFLLSRVSELTEGKSLKANLALLHNNARLAAQIARVLAPFQGQITI